jgi:hypothetical protein
MLLRLLTTVTVPIAALYGFTPVQAEAAMALALQRVAGRRRA